jgi:aryl-alcohol dehydrogenase-like predicted oxidoreductase
MKKRKLGNRNLEVSALGLGCMRMSFGDAPVGTREEMIALLHDAVDRGIAFFDTAGVYGPFAAASRAFRPRRSGPTRHCSI